MVVFGVGLCISELNINKFNAIYIFLIYYICIGLNYVCNHFKIGFGTVIICYCIMTGMFLNYYFTEFSNEDHYLFENDIIYATQMAEEKNPEKIYVENYSYIYTLVANRLDVNTFNNTYVRVPDGIHSYGKYVFDIYEGSEINENAVYIIKNDLYFIDILEDNGFSKKDVRKNLGFMERK